ncbi:iron chelate uptake ABC transporter family permease subunit [Psittacicella hinzii]|uniref:Iron complex transport system permease protein n=1 Tax=Psittacicella hinzii TaxID=2028575 RepID=A0A3A1YK02_9GAMM|nr:iron chelate uptake ABC transporter family permease subunit [Psittacicella hinzii]RIY37528.1 hypothetical protein CKF58_04775 [Psittacicella hinzii]
MVKEDDKLSRVGHYGSQSSSQSSSQSDDQSNNQSNSSNSCNNLSNNQSNTTNNSEANLENKVSAGAKTSPYTEQAALLQRKNKRQSLCRTWILVLIALSSIITYLCWGGIPKNSFVFNMRWHSVVAIILTGAAIGASSMVFQAIVNNRIITPSILGLDSLYVLIQTCIVFVAGAEKLTDMNQTVLFLISLAVMLVFSFLLFKIMLRRSNHNVFFILLLSIVFGTLFSSFNTFMGTLLDPGEFLAVQSIGYASFQAINTQVLTVSAIFLGVTFVLIWRCSKYLDVIALGKDTAVNLGIDYYRLTWRLLFLVVICVAVSTALVGPVTFLGLLVMNLILQYIPSFRYRLLIPACIFLSIAVLVLGQILVQRLFSFTTTISIIINFLGGCYFIFLLIRQQRKW